MSLLDLLLGRGEDDEGPTWEYHLLKDSPPPKDTVEIFPERAPSREYVQYHLDLDAGSYHLQAVDPETARWGGSEWQLDVEETEEDRLEQELSELRATVEAAAQQDDGDDAPSFPDDPEELSSTLLGELAQERGASAALDRLERLEAAKSGDDLLGAIDDKTDRDEVVNSIILSAFEKYGDDAGEILRGLKMLGGSSSDEQIDPAALQQQIQERAAELGVEQSAGSPAGSAAVADGSGDDLDRSSVRQLLEDEIEDDESEEGDDGGE